MSVAVLSTLVGRTDDAQSPRVDGTFVVEPSLPSPTLCLDHSIFSSDDSAMPLRQMASIYCELVSLDSTGSPPPSCAARDGDPVRRARLLNPYAEIGQCAERTAISVRAGVASGVQQGSACAI